MKRLAYRRTATTPPRPSSALLGNGGAKPGQSAGQASFQGNVAAQRVPLSALHGNGYAKPVWSARRASFQESAGTSVGSGHTKPGRKMRRGDRLNNCDRSLQWPLPARGEGARHDNRGRRANTKRATNPRATGTLIAETMSIASAGSLHCHARPAPRPGMVTPNLGGVLGWRASKEMWQHNVFR